jgi:hypothetical protein
MCNKGCKIAQKSTKVQLFVAQRSPLTLYPKSVISVIKIITFIFRQMTKEDSISAELSNGRFGFNH